MTSLIATATEASHPKPIILAIFAVTYVGIAMGRVPGLKLNRVGIALLGAIAMMIFSGIGTTDVVSCINWPTIFLLFGFFVISAQLRLSGFYDKVANGISARLGHPAWFLLVLMVVTGGLSAFLNHDIVCYVFTPIAGAALLRKQINPVPFLIALAISSNIGGAATLIGNPQDMMIGQVAHLSFGRYLLWSSVPVIFAMAAAYGIIWMFSRKTLQSSLPAPDELKYQVYPFNRLHTIKGLIILAVVIGLFFSPLPKEIIVLAAASIHLASTKFRTDDLLGMAHPCFVHGTVRRHRRFPIHRLRRPNRPMAGAWRIRSQRSNDSGSDDSGVVQSDQQRTDRDVAAQGHQSFTAHRSLHSGAGQQLRRKPYHHRQHFQHHRGSTGARAGDQNFLLGFRPIGHSGDIGRIGRTYRLDCLGCLRAY
jgi:di/tricarboxylate transporter